MNLPDAVVDVTEGRRSPADVPGAVRHEPEGLLRTIWKGAVTEPAGRGLMNWMHRLWIYRPWSYWLYSVVFGAGLLVVGGTGLAYGPWWPDWVLWIVIGLGVLTLADMLAPRKWRGLEQVSSDLRRG